MQSRIHDFPSPSLAPPSTYEGETQLGEFLSEVRNVFKDELDNQVSNKVKAAKEKNVEEDALSAHEMDMEQDEDLDDEEREKKAEEEEEKVGL